MKKIINKIISFRPFVALLGFIGFNSYFQGFIKGIYMGDLKRFCAPFINCHSCPAATFACPAGLIQHYLIYRSFDLWYIPKFVLGYLIFISLFVGKLICGWLCPFGMFQTLLFKLKTKKIYISPKFRFIKYLVFAILLILLPILLAEPWFCKLCPVGSLEAGIPLVLFGNASANLRAIAGNFFNIKLGILLTFLISSVLIKRPFCRFFCPIGTIYTIFNRLSILKVFVDESKCIHCGKCTKVCPIEEEASIATKKGDCFLCGECIKVCPTGAVKYGTIFNPPKKSNTLKRTSIEQN